MALSGTINGTTGNQYVDCKVVWSAEQNLEQNYSVITATLSYSRTNTGYETYGKFIGALTINGTRFENEKYITVSYSSNTVAITATETVPHNADGTKSVSISATGYIRGTTVDATYLSGTITLNEIARQATITSAENFTDEENPTITYLNKAGNTVSSLQACISFTGEADNVPYRDIPKTGTTYTFNLTEEERNVLRARFPTAKSGNVRFYVRTQLNGKYYYSYLTKTLSIVNANPVMNPTAVDVDTATLALTGNSNRLIKYYSDVKAIMNAESVKKTSLVSYKITCGGKSSTNSSATLTNVESGNIVFTATDERGNSTTKTVKKTLVPYIKLTCNLAPTSPTTGGTMTLNISGNYYNASFGAVANTLTLQYRMKEDTSAYGNWQTVSPTITGNTYSIEIPISGLNYQSQYIFQARASDKLATKTTPEKGVKTNPVFDWGKDDFNINGSFNLYGNAALRYNRENNNLVVSTNNATDGVFIRPNGTGSNEGQAIFKTNGDLSISGNLIANGQTIGQNKVLWSGSYKMTAGHTITLSEAVSQQTSGIVLVFSQYNDSTSAAVNSNFSCHFVPKQLIALQGGASSTYMMSRANFSYIACKVLYIGDTQIRGHDLNGQLVVFDGNNTGFYYDNGSYVLRYVIGV